MPADCRSGFGLVAGAGHIGTEIDPATVDWLRRLPWGDRPVRQKARSGSDGVIAGRRIRRTPGLPPGASWAVFRHPPPATFIGSVYTLSRAVMNSVLRSGPPNVTFDGGAGSGISPSFRPDGANTRTWFAFGVT